MRTRNSLTPKTPASKKAISSKKLDSDTPGSTTPPMGSTPRSAEVTSVSTRTRQARNVTTRSAGKIAAQDKAEGSGKEKSVGANGASPQSASSKQVTPGSRSTPKRKAAAKSKTLNSGKTFRGTPRSDNTEKEVVTVTEDAAFPIKNDKIDSEGVESINEETNAAVGQSAAIDFKESTNVDEKIQKIGSESIAGVDEIFKTTEKVASGSKKASPEVPAAKKETSGAKSAAKKKTTPNSKTSIAVKAQSSSASKSSDARSGGSAKKDGTAAAAVADSVKEEVCLGSVEFFEDATAIRDNDLATLNDDGTRMTSNAISEEVEPMEAEEVDILEVKEEVIEVFNDDEKDKENLKSVVFESIKNAGEGVAEGVDNITIVVSQKINVNKVEEVSDAGKIVGKSIPESSEVSRQGASSVKVIPDGKTVAGRKAVVKKKTPYMIKDPSGNMSMPMDVTKGNVECSAAIDEVAVVSDSESMEVVEAFSQGAESVMIGTKSETVQLRVDENITGEKEVIESKEMSDEDIKEQRYMYMEQDEGCNEKGEKSFEGRNLSTSLKNDTIEEPTRENWKPGVYADVEHHVKKEEYFEEHRNEEPADEEKLEGETADDQTDDAGSGDEIGHEEQMELTAHARERTVRKEVEIFVGGLDRDATEDDIKNAFDVVGNVIEIRLHKDPLTVKNRGYAFVKFAKKEQAKRAVLEMKKPVIRGKQCQVFPSQDNNTLFLGNICNTWTREAVKQKIKDYGIVNVENVTLVKDPSYEGLSRGFAFVEFSRHADAMNAFKRLQKPDVIFGHPEKTAKVAFSVPLREADPEIMAHVKSVFIDGLPPHWDEDQVREQFKCYGEVEKVTLARNMLTAKRKDFGFVDFATHDEAVSCINGVNMAGLVDCNSKINAKARLANPLPKTQPVKGKMAGGFQIGRAPPNFQNYGRGFGRFVSPSSRSSFPRGRGFHPYNRGGRTGGSIGQRGFTDPYGSGRSIAGTSRYNTARNFFPRGRSFSGNYNTGGRFVHGESAGPSFYNNPSRGVKRQFHMTDPSATELNRNRPRLDYTDPTIFHKPSYPGNLEPGTSLVPHNYYSSNRGGTAPPSAHGFGKPHRGGYY